MFKTDCFEAGCRLTSIAFLYALVSNEVLVALFLFAIGPKGRNISTLVKVPKLFSLIGGVAPFVAR